MREARRAPAGAIIAGGRASRFGGLAKGLELVGGIRIVDRVAAVLRPSTSRLIIAPGDSPAEGWIDGAEIARDILDERSSLTGIHAALAAADSDIIAIAWDMPFVPAALVAGLAARVADGCVAIVPRVNGQPQPLCAGYSRAARQPIEELARSGELRMTRVLDALPRVAWMEGDELAALGDPATMFFNVNSAADLARAREIERQL